MTAVHPDDTSAGTSDVGASAFDRLAVTEDTIVGTLARLREDGFVGDFVLEPEDIPPGLWCRSCGRRHLPERTNIAAVHRFEGPSSPEDEALLLALVCPRCGAKGTVVTGYGPIAAPEEAELLSALGTRASSRFPHVLAGRSST
jgi:hypothetical protein